MKQTNRMYFGNFYFLRVTLKCLGDKREESPLRSRDVARAKFAMGANGVDDAGGDTAAECEVQHQCADGPINGAREEPPNTNGSFDYAI